MERQTDYISLADLDAANAASKQPRYVVYEMYKGAGVWHIMDTVAKRQLTRAWPQQNILRAWKSEKAARKICDAMNYDIPQ